VLILERIERQYLADRTAFVSAAYAAGAEVVPPSWDEQVAELDAALVREPVFVSGRERSNRSLLRELGVA
jgi:hypothetical protein